MSDNIFGYEPSETSGTTPPELVQGSKELGQALNQAAKEAIYQVPSGYIPPERLIPGYTIGDGRLDNLLRLTKGEPVPEREVAAGVVLAAPGYDDLADVLRRAFTQASRGKGKERHAQEGEDFNAQVILEGARRFGTGALLFQAYKKSEESQRLPTDRGVNELLGAIIYLAAAVIHREEQ